MSAAAIISPSRAPTTASGTRSRSYACATPRSSPSYYGNAIIALVSEAWLGPAYQITSQLNVVNPGGAAQVAHRDYHLGFQSAEAIERFPVHVHRLSPVLTLQGAVAHCDMPVETGPTLYLPFSQSYVPGYMATGRAEFREYFDKHHVQLPLMKGDAVFFNPALFHAAGTNRSKDVRRIANLLQVSSAFGRAMESVDRLKMSLNSIRRSKISSPRKPSPRPRPTTRSRLQPRVIPSRPTSIAIRQKAAWRRRASRI